MSIGLKSIPRSEVYTTVESRLKGIFRGLGYWAARDAALKLCIRGEMVKKQPNQ